MSVPLLSISQNALVKSLVLKMISNFEVPITAPVSFTLSSCLPNQVSDHGMCSAACAPRLIEKPLYCFLSQPLNFFLSDGRRVFHGNSLTLGSSIEIWPLST